MSAHETGTGMVTPHAIDRYWVESIIGRGGFGAVYRARHMHTRQVVALKMLRASAPPGAHGANPGAHLVREAQILATVRHRNIVQVFDAGVVDGAAFIAMELVEGASIEQLLAQTPALPLPTVLALATQLLDGLAAAHAVGVVHRDIKPGNLLVVPDGTLKILDFGISKSSVVQVSASSQGSWVGTPGYMAPEQYGAGAVDLRADLYAAAVTIYRMAAGERPFPESDFAALLSRVMRERAPSLSTRVPHAPPALVHALDRALLRDPDARFASADEFRSALSAMGGSGMATEATQSAPHSPRTQLLPRISSAPPPMSAPNALGVVTPSPLSPAPAMYVSAPPGPITAANLTPQGFSPPATTAGAAPANRGWGLALGLVGALVVACGAALFFVARHRATPQAEADRTSPSSTSKVSLSVPPVSTVVRTGTFTTTQVCQGNDSIRFEKATFQVKDGPALIADDNCDLILVDSTIRGPIGVRTNSGDVVMRGGSVVADKVAFDLTGASNLTLDGVSVSAPDGVRAGGPGTMDFRKVKLVATGTGIALSNVDITLTDTDVSGGITALRTTLAGSTTLHRGSLGGSRWALDLGGTNDVTVDGTRIDGPTRRDPLVSVRGLPGMASSGLPVAPQASASAQPTVAPLSSGAPPGPAAGAAVVKPGIAIFYPLTVPEGLDPNAFVKVASAAAPAARACLPVGQATTVRIQIMIDGPEVPANDHKIALLGPSADNTGQPAVARCVAEAFRRVVPNPWHATGDTRIIHFDVRLGP